MGTVRSKMTTVGLNEIGERILCEGNTVGVSLILIFLFADVNLLSVRHIARIFQESLASHFAGTSAIKNNVNTTSIGMLMCLKGTSNARNVAEWKL